MHYCVHYTNVIEYYILDYNVLGRSTTENRAFFLGVSGGSKISGDPRPLRRMPVSESIVTLTRGRFRWET